MKKFFPNYTVGEDAYSAIPEICSKYGTKIILIGGKKALAASKGEIEKSIEKSGLEIIDTVWYGGEASVENSQMLCDLESYKAADMVFAVGGGKAMDACKYATFLSGKAIFTFPTIAATCAAASSETIMYYPNGESRGIVEINKPAEHVFINTKIITQAPEIYLWSGIGDTMAKHFETSLAARGQNNLTYCQALGVNMGKMCYEPLVKFGEKALEECEYHITGEALEQILLTNIITTGIVSGFVGGRINSNVAHALCYGFTMLPQVEKNHLHGEIVSYCTLVLLMLDGQRDKVEELYPMYKAVKLPTSLSELEVEKEDLKAPVEKAVSISDTKLLPYKVTAEMFFKAIEDLEKYNMEKN